MPSIHPSPRRSLSTTPAAAPAPTTGELKNSNNAGLALAGVPRRKLNISFPGFPTKGTQAAQAAATTAPTATTPPTVLDAQTSILPTPDSSARSTPSPTTEVPRTASPARKPIFNVGSPKDDHKSYFDALKHSSSSGSGSSTSESEDDADMPRFNRLNFNGRDVDGLAQCRERIDAQEKPSEDITQRSRPANTLPADAAKERERDSGFFELPSSTAPSQQSTPDVPRGGKPPALNLTGIRDAVPFPKGQGTESPPVLRGAPYTFPNVDGPPSPSVLPRTPSTPIILSNGKPLKSSLKSSASSPNFAPMHTRTRSAPTTPGVLDSPTPKNVHFPTRNEELQKVRLFRPAGRPTAVSFDGGAEETETETEGYESSGYPFPVTPVQPQQETIVTLNTGLTSPVPRPSATHASGGAMYANVHLETMQLPKTRPYTLVGSVLVRNVAYNKSVAIRFTMDDWQTTSEVTAHYVSSLPSLPPPFHESRSSPLVGDAITSLSHASVGWDRFGWQVKLEDVTERRLAEKTMYLVVRYQAHGDGGGEWWDNNSGANYRVVFRKETATAPTKPTAGPLGPSSSSAARQLAHQIRAENRSGGLPPLQLKAKRPSLSTNWSFGNAPRNVGGTGRAAGGVDFGQPAHHASHAHHNGHGHHGHHAASNGHKSAPHSPASPKLSLKNYCPPTSPKSPPPSATSLPSLTASITQQPSPPRSPVRTSGPTLELTTREVLTDDGVPISVPVPIGASGPTVPLPSTTSEPEASGAAANGRLPPNLVLPARPQVDFSRGAFGGSEDNSPSGVMSPIGSPGTNASYEALVKQWCFGGSSNAVGPQAGICSGFADQSQHAAAGFMSRGFNSGRLVGVGEMA